MSIGHAERRHPPCLGAETPAGSCRRSVRVHQPWLSAPRVSLAANLVVRHSTPNSTAPRSHPASPEHARAHGSGEAAATAQCRPARVKPFADLLLRPSHHRTDFQPPCARPWPRRHAPVSNPSIPVEAAAAIRHSDHANELVKAQIGYSTFLAALGADSRLTIFVQRSYIATHSSLARSAAPTVLQPAARAWPGAAKRCPAVQWPAHCAANPRGHHMGIMVRRLQGQDQH
jgi:hypothetical protein